MADEVKQVAEPLDLGRGARCRELAQRIGMQGLGKVRKDGSRTLLRPPAAATKRTRSNAVTSGVDTRMYPGVG